MSWECPECGLQNEDGIVRCVCGYEVIESSDLMFSNPFKKKNIRHPVFREGKLAFQNGFALSDNPYTVNTEFSSSWISGWKQAKQVREKRIGGPVETKTTEHSILTKNEKLDFYYSLGESAYYNGFKLSDNPYPVDTEFFPLWKTGWEKAFQVRRTFEEKEKTANALSNSQILDSDPEFYKIGFGITAVITFIACWIYAIVSWGFLLGLGLGWIPSFFIAALAGFIWPLLALVLILGLCIVAFLAYKSS